MSKEPNKDFRERIRDEIKATIIETRPKNEVVLLNRKQMDEATTRILALCKEMLVPNVSKNGSDDSMSEGDEGWNACRQHLLKQLGEK